MKPNLFVIMLAAGGLLFGAIIWSRATAPDRMHAAAEASGLASVELAVEQIT